MPNQQPSIPDQRGRRHFACSPVAVLGLVVNEAEQILLLAHPRRHGAWEVVNGALEHEETILAGVLREISEEIGPQVRVRPLGAVHAFTFSYDQAVRYMITICYLVAYEGGPIEPGDDMRGSAFRWWSLDDLEAEDVRLLVPKDQKWVLRRAVELYRLWHNQAPDLQPPLDPHARPKDADPDALQTP